MGVQITDGTTTLPLRLTGQEHTVRDFAALRVNRQGKVISAAAPGGIAPRVERTVSAEATDAERAALAAFHATNPGTAIRYTDTVGREWNARWLGPLETRETAYAADGWHVLTLRLLLEGVYSDAGRTAWANAASAMSIQKTGAALLYFPWGYDAPLGREGIATSHQQETPGGLAVDAARYTAREDRTLNFTGWPDSFATEFFDYFTNTMQGAVYPATLTHSRDGAAAYRIIEGLRFTQGAGRRWSGSLKLRREV